MVSLNFDIVDSTVRQQAAKSSITILFVNLNTVHPIDAKSEVFFSSILLLSSEQWHGPSTSIASIIAGIPMSTL